MSPQLKMAGVRKTYATGAVEVEGNTSLLGLLEVDGANLEMAAAAIELNAADNNVLGAMTVEGDIIMDGMQVLAI